MKAAVHQQKGQCGACVSCTAYCLAKHGLFDSGANPVRCSVPYAGNAWVAGPIPNALRQLRNLTLINLSNNWINGTLPDWLHELEHLETLMLGSMFGHNEGSDLVGLQGTIPRDLGRLKKLRKLNLESNSLTGTLPPLCRGGERPAACCASKMLQQCRVHLY
jgi:hypothetical protein